MPTITIHDETTAGQALHELTLDVLTETITVRELIRSRVYQEVEDFNRGRRKGSPDKFRGLVQPVDAETALNGYTLKKPRDIDWRVQFEKACDAFEGNGILILVDDRQVTDLDEELALDATSKVTFLKLVPLVGG